eukprot:6455077-Amphidinium_carterae.1
MSNLGEISFETFWDWGGVGVDPRFLNACICVALIRIQEVIRTLLTMPMQSLGDSQKMRFTLQPLRNL